MTTAELVMASGWTGPAPHRVRPREALRHTLAMTRRNLMKISGDPGQLLDAVVMPIVFSVAFVFVFGGAIASPSGNYAQFFIPGMMALNMTIMSRSTGIGLAVDFGTGVIDRFRSMPIARSAVLSGRITADALRMLLSQLVIMLVALVIGFRTHGGLLGTLGALLLFLGYGVALCWISAFIGISARSVPTVETLTTLWMVPLQFASSVFVPPSTMPGWLQVVAGVNPMTVVVDAGRGLLGGDARTGSVLGAIAWIVGLIAVFAPLSVRRYRRRR